MQSTVVGDFLQGIRHKDGGEVLLESNTVFLAVKDDTNLLLVSFDKKSQEKHQKEYDHCLGEIGPQALKRPLLNHRKGVPTSWKRAGKVLMDNVKARGLY